MPSPLFEDAPPSCLANLPSTRAEKADVRIRNQPVRNEPKKSFPINKTAQTSNPDRLLLAPQKPFQQTGSGFAHLLFHGGFDVGSENRVSGGAGDGEGDCGAVNRCAHSKVESVLGADGAVAVQSADRGHDELDVLRAQAVGRHADGGG